MHEKESMDACPGGGPLVNATEHPATRGRDSERHPSTVRGPHDIRLLRTQSGEVARGSTQRSARPVGVGCQEPDGLRVRSFKVYSSTRGNPTANSTLTMMTETKPIERKGWRSTSVIVTAYLPQ